MCGRARARVGMWVRTSRAKHPAPSCPTSTAPAPATKYPRYCAQGPLASGLRLILEQMYDSTCPLSDAPLAIVPAFRKLDLRGLGVLARTRLGRCSCVCACALCCPCVHACDGFDGMCVSADADKQPQLHLRGFAGSSKPQQGSARSQEAAHPSC